MDSLRTSLDMDGPAIYAISVQGHVAPDWEDRLAGMQISVSHSAEGPHTKLVGRLSDQAALLGVVISLFNLGFPILNVNLLSKQ
jgi:hypothetical protein